MALAAFGFFFNVSLRIRPDGSGKMIVEYPPNPVTSFASEGQRFASASSTVTGFRILNGKAQVRVRFGDVNGLKETPGLSNSILNVEAGPDGTGQFHAVLRTVAPRDEPVLDNTETAHIQVQFPGALIAANAQQIEGATATWREPVRDFLSRNGIRLEATFLRRPQVAAALASANAKAAE